MGESRSLWTAVVTRETYFTNEIQYDIIIENGKSSTDLSMIFVARDQN